TAGAQVVADLPAGQRDKLERVPKRIFASNISGLTGLYDNIVTQLRADGYDMSVGSKIRQELRRKLWNLDVHFDEAVNNKPPRPAAEAADGSAPAGGEAEAPRPEGETRGYKFTLEDDGVPVATIRVYADRRTGAVRMGSTSDKAHIEGVRTGILGQGGEYTVMQSSGMTFGVGTDLPLHKLPWDLAEIYKKYVKLGLTGRGGVSWNSNDGGGATRASLNVVVSRYTGFTLGHQVPFRFAAEVSTLARPGLAPRRTPSVDGSAVLRMSEPDAFDHGFSVDEDAFAPDPADTAAPPEDAPATKAPPTEPATEAPKDASSTGAPPTGKKPAKQVPYDQWRRRLRNTGRHPEDTGGNVLPEHVRLGRGLGQGLPDIDEAAIARIRTGMGNLLRDNGFLPPDQDRPWMVDAPPPAAPVRPAPPADGAPADGAPADGAPATDDESSDGEASESTPLLPPGNPVREGYNEAVKRDRKQLVQNQDLFDKMVSNDGLESHFDPLSQDGMTFVLHSWRNSVMRTAEVTVRAVSRITDAVDAEGNSVHFVRLTDELHTVTLAMSLGIAGQGASGNQGFSLEGGLRLPMPEQVQALDSVGLFGGSISRSIGAAERLTRIVNRPELTEYSGRVALHDLPYDLVYTVKFSDRATPVTSTPVPATVRSAVLRLNTDPSVFSETAAANTEPSVLDQAVVYFLDTHGVRAAAEGQLPAKLTRTGAPMVGPVYSLSSHISLQANFKEALASQYTTDTLVEPGFWYNTNAALSIGVPRIGGARFVGATPDQYVAGLIDLYLTETANTASRSFAHSYNLPDFKLAHNFGPIKTSYENSTSVKVSESESAETKRTGGLEILDLSFKRAYAFEAPVDFGVRSGIHTQIGFVYDGVDVPAASNVSGRTMLFLLPEAQALAEYAAGRLPISQPQLLEAMTRWSRGELVLSGNTVAGLLTRWQRALARSAARGAPDLSAYLVRHRVRAFAQELAARHADPQQRSAVADPARKTAFRDAFHIQLDPAVDPFSTLSIPPYLTRTGARTLGHHGVDKLTLYSGPAPKGGGPRPTTTLLDAVHTHVNAVAPGLLGPSHGRWADARSTWRVLMFSPNLRAVGNLPGGIDTLQAVLAGQRVNATFSDMLNRYNGVRFFLINRDGPVLSDVVGLTVWASLDGRPRYVDWVPEYGIENYGHNYGGYGLTLARALGWSLTPAKFGFSSDGSPISGDFSFGFAPLGGYSLKGGYQLTREQTAYDWSGHYLAVQDVTVNIGAQRLKMHNRYANNFGQALWKLANNAAADLLPAGLTDFTALLRVQDESSRAYPGKLEFKVPRGLAEAQPVPRTPGVDLRPLPSFPGDVYVSGVLADDLYPAAGKLMSRLLSSDADDPSYRGNLALSGLLSRLNVDNHLPDTLGPDGYLLGSHLFVSGASNNRAALRLYGSLHSMEVVSKIVNATGTGRYAKFHLVSAASQNRSRWRTNFAFELAFGKPLGDTNVGAQEHTTAKITFTTGANRNAPMNQSATYEDTKRSETHLKMQGVVYLVKLRGRFHLGGVQHRHHMFSTDNGLDTFGPEKFRGARSSGTVTGDVYVEMFADEFEDLRLALDSPHDWAAANPSRWPAPSARARTFDLTDLLERTTPRAMAANPVAGRTIQAGDFDPGQAAPHAALLIRHRLGNHYEQVAPIRLTVNAVEQARRRYELTLNWAIDRLTRAAEPGSPPAALLTRLAGWQVEVAPVAAGGPMPDGLAQAFGPRTEQIIEQVRALQPPGSPPLTPPDEVVMLGHDPIDVARGVAFELGTHLDLTVTPVTGAARRYRIDPQGWVVQLRPTATGGHVVPTAASVVATLPADLRNRATAAGVDPADAYAHLLTTTSVQTDAADGLRDEVEERIRQARDSADDRTRRWLAEGLPTLPGTPLPDGPVWDTPDGRAGRVRRLLSAALGPGWTTSGPLRQVPAAPRPGTRLWIARPQGAFA
ncbi:MAG TPA: hypothetical protein VHA75_15205, partial [Rugosimonospora sp.]|nr:hypothetical protein [Rugosimonospora sp.]